jgi:hypothetical protein
MRLAQVLPKFSRQCHQVYGHRQGSAPINRKWNNDALRLTITPKHTPRLLEDLRDWARVHRLARNILLNAESKMIMRGAVFAETNLAEGKTRSQIHAAHLAGRDWLNSCKP